MLHQVLSPCPLNYFAESYIAWSGVEPIQDHNRLVGKPDHGSSAGIGGKRSLVRTATRRIQTVKDEASESN